MLSFKTQVIPLVICVHIVCQIEWHNFRVLCLLYCWCYLQTAEPKKTMEFFTAEAQPASSPSACSIPVHSAGKPELKSYHQGQRLTEVIPAHVELQRKMRNFLHLGCPPALLQGGTQISTSIEKTGTRHGNILKLRMRTRAVTEKKKKTLQPRAVRLRCEKEKLSAPETVWGTSPGRWAAEVQPASPQCLPQGCKGKQGVGHHDLMATLQAAVCRQLQSLF